jgi:hypothetical protein
MIIPEFLVTRSCGAKNVNSCSYNISSATKLEIDSLFNSQPLVQQEPTWYPLNIDFYSFIAAKLVRKLGPEPF